MPKEYRVEKIVSKRIVKGKPEYQIKWDGYPMSQCTWEPEEHLEYCMEMVRDFNRKKQPTPNSSQINSKSQGKNAIRSKPSIEAISSEEDGEKEWSSRRNNKAQKTVKGFSASKRRMEAIINENEEQDEQNYNEIYEEKNDGDNEDETNEESINVLSLWSDSKDNVFYRIRRNGNESTVSRSELIKLDVLSLLEFYEQHLEFMPNQQQGV